MGLNHLQSLICTYSADDLRPLMPRTLRSSDLIFLRKLETLRVLTESGIEFQIDTPILVKDFFIFPVLENLTEKHSFADNRVL